jgi:hypothetical protein
VGTGAGAGVGVGVGGEEGGEVEGGELPGPGKGVEHPGHKYNSSSSREGGVKGMGGGELGSGPLMRGQGVGGWKAWPRKRPGMGKSSLMGLLCACSFFPTLLLMYSIFLCY